MQVLFERRFAFGTDYLRLLDGPDRLNHPLPCDFERQGVKPNLNAALPADFRELPCLGITVGRHLSGLS